MSLPSPPPPNSIERTGAEQPRIEKPLYGGDGLAHTPAGDPLFVPYVLPGELVELRSEAGARNARLFDILEPSPDRTEPQCVHFGTCGGCQYQMAAYPAQLALKVQILTDLLTRAGVPVPSVLRTLPSPHPYGYRNRVRLRLQPVDGELRVGYNLRKSNEFLPISMCPIATPLLWRAATTLLAAAKSNRDVARTLQTAGEVELFCDAPESRLQVMLLYPGKTTPEPKAFARAMEAVQALCPELSGAGVVRTDPQSGRPLGSQGIQSTEGTDAALPRWGAAGLPYRVGEETYWISRGGFFQVNRFLLPELVALVCGDRSGTLAWDLFAGVGLFSRVLARRFEAVTAVESSPVAGADLHRALGKLGPRHRAVQTTASDFLRRAVVDRERPDLIVLDPPRAGAGEEACRLLAQLAPAEMVYLSCDPTTLARDLSVLTAAGYTVAELHLIDLFPQTLHIETLAVLRRPVAD